MSDDAVDVRKYDRSTSSAERERMRNNPPRILLTNLLGVGEFFIAAVVAAAINPGFPK